jgi:hypothetical protein
MKTILQHFITKLFNFTSNFINFIFTKFSIFNIKQILNNSILFINKNSIVIGLKKGIKKEMLPNKVQLFLSNTIVRICRVIGGVCVIICLFIRNDKISIDFPNWFFILICFISLLHIFQMLIIS